MEQAAVEEYRFSYLNAADEPVIEALQVYEWVLAKHQPQYIALRVLPSNGSFGERMSRWTLTPEQRQIIADGGDIFLELSTFQEAMQPIRIAVGLEANPEYVAACYGLTMPLAGTTVTPACHHGLPAGEAMEACTTGFTVVTKEAKAEGEEG